MRGKAPRNERPQRHSEAPGSAGGVGVYWGKWSTSGDFLLLFPPGPFFLTAAGAVFCRDAPRLPQVQFLSPAGCLLSSGAGGFSGRPAESRSLPDPSKVAAPGKLSLFPSARIVFRKTRLSCSLPLILSRSLELGTAEPSNTSWGSSGLAADQSSQLLGPVSSQDSKSTMAVAVAAAALLSP